MNTLKAVLRHLNKEEVNLSAEKVELGIVQDIIKDFAKAQDTFTSAMSMMDRAAEQLENLDKKVSELKRQAKELGVDLPKGTMDLISKMDSMRKEAREKSR